MIIYVFGNVLGFTTGRHPFNLSKWNPNLTWTQIIHNVKYANNIYRCIYIYSYEDEFP